MTTDARNASSIRCSGWFRNGCSAFYRVTRMSTITIRADSVLALAVGCTDLTGEERVRERDRGIPLAGSSTLNRVGRSRRSRDAPVQEDHGRSAGRSQACPSTPVRRRRKRSGWTSTPPTTWCMATRRGVTSTATTTLTVTFRFTWDDLILCSRLRPANVDPAAGTAEELACGAHSRSLAGDRGSRRRRAATNS